MSLSSCDVGKYMKKGMVMLFIDIITRSVTTARRYHVLVQKVQHKHLL